MRHLAVVLRSLVEGRHHNYPAVVVEDHHSLAAGQEDRRRILAAVADLEEGHPKKIDVSIGSKKSTQRDVTNILILLIWLLSVLLLLILR